MYLLTHEEKDIFFSRYLDAYTIPRSLSPVRVGGESSSIPIRFIFYDCLMANLEQTSWVKVRIRVRVRVGLGLVSTSNPKLNRAIGTKIE